MTVAVKRFIDRKDAESFIKDTDFYRRPHGIPLVRLAMGLLIILLATIIPLGRLIAALYHLETGEPAPAAEDVLLVLAIVMTGAICTGFAGIALISKIRKTVNVVEFQNLVFATSMRLGSDFCMILHGSGTAIYADYNFYEMFEEFKDDDAYGQLLASKGLSESEEEKLKKALEAGVDEELSFEINDIKYRLVIKHLSRPKGFFLLKARPI